MRCLFYGAWASSRSWAQLWEQFAVTDPVSNSCILNPSRPVPSSSSSPRGLPRAVSVLSKSQTEYCCSRICLLIYPKSLFQILVRYSQDGLGCGGVEDSGVGMAGRAHGARTTHLGVADGVDDAGRGDVEDTRAALRGVHQSGAVEEIPAEDAEAALAGAGGKGEQVLRLRTVICGAPPGQ